MMRSVATIVRLRWALTFAAMRKSVGQTIGYVVGLLLGLGGVALVAVLAFDLGGHAAEIGPFRAGTVLVDAFGAIMVVMVQVLYLGQRSTLSPGRFALYGIPDRTLSLGLLAAGLSGLPSIMGAVALLLWSAAFRPFGALAVIVQLVAALLAVLTIMSLSKLAIAAATSLVRSKRSRSVLYIVAVLFFVFVMQIPSIMTANSGSDADVYEAAVGVHLGTDMRFDTYSGMADVLAWTPFGAAFQLPFDAMAGAWGPFAARLAVIAATVALCFAGSTACLRHDRLTVGAAERTVTARGLGAFGRVPDSASGAIAARLLTYLRRDPRQALFFAMPLLMTVLMALQSRGIGEVVWMGPVMGGWFMFLAEGNGLAYDGRGYAMEVICGVPGTADRRGRAGLLAVIGTVYLLILAVCVAAFTGLWYGGSDPVYAIMITGVSLGLAYASLGVAEIVSVILMYPVPSVDRPFSSPQGRAVAQGFFPFVQMLGTPLTLVPTAVAGVVMAFAGAFGSDAGWLALGACALVNGAAALALGTWLGGKLLDARSLSVLRTLDGFASLQQ
ncbi:ABC transporter permease [Bifidobacterium sp. DSM 109958]|uniref:ABC transporter permease n=1 Tax=Bifidobacterium moraviense TaxID=2675323 RepID=A0A7Y0F144_9BIFI|nr:ABC transporter permease [Bifidobacterium sp. DSM 109958]NMN00095.1 ABC transporter permease [Bifidobacterium sp. DSM 109958]